MKHAVYAKAFKEVTRDLGDFLDLNVSPQAEYAVFNEPVLQTAAKALSKPHLLDRVRHVVRCKHYRIRGK